eukprot:TRINITY_DN218_c2_g1_i2.p1 TRINITY_DN218_c2_g1~~TRINITY_DN218_c2_g1_i2.p1  ORF type:complete len:178 (-),score=47.04 TRINITY_DN218_c2_g1_i2:126-623(-)
MPDLVKILRWDRSDEESTYQRGSRAAASAAASNGKKPARFEGLMGRDSLQGTRSMDSSGRSSGKYRPPLRQANSTGGSSGSVYRPPKKNSAIIPDDFVGNRRSSSNNNNNNNSHSGNNRRSSNNKQEFEQLKGETRWVPRSAGKSWDTEEPQEDEDTVTIRQCRG